MYDIQNTMETKYANKLCTVSYMEGCLLYNNIIIMSLHASALNSFTKYGILNRVR